MLGGNVAEYTYTLGISVSFIGLIVALFFGRREILKAFRDSKLDRWGILIAVLIVALFVAIEFVVVKPTQLLFFDDAIYQAMGQQLLHSGQAWMCDYGTPTFCHIGEIFHEPIGLSFNLAIAFAAFGISRATAYGTGLFLSALSVFLTFMAGQLLFRSRTAAGFGALILALSPVLLVWAMPTNSDIAVLAYSLVAFLMLVIFTRIKTVWTFAAALLSLSLLLYMKVLAVLYIPLWLLLYIVLDREALKNSAKGLAGLLRRNWFRTGPLIALLVFVVGAVPAVLFTYMQFTSGNFGYHGTSIQDTCGQNYYTAASNINLNNFRYNICANLEFWFNSFRGNYVMQSEIITLLAIFGGTILAVSKGREFSAIALWFLAFFLLYTAFYAGSVLYGVDWRFMLSLIAQVSLLAGFGCAYLIGIPSEYASRRMRRPLMAAAAAAVLVVVGYAFYSNLQQMAVNPANIPQAPDARFYENFVYQDAHLINSSCLVFTYDPTLFNINNRTAAQMSYAYDQSKLQQYESGYGCLVADIGYWCYTPNNLCTGLNSSFTMTPIVNATFAPRGIVYGFYYLKPKLG